MQPSSPSSDSPHPDSPCPDSPRSPSVGQAHLDGLKRLFYDALAQGDLNRAQQLIEAAIRLAPEASATKALYASVLTRMGKHADAAEELEAAFRIEPGMIEYLGYAAGSWERARRPDKAGDLITRLLTLDPLHPTGLALLARLAGAKLAGRTDDKPAGCVWPQGTGIAGWAWDCRRHEERLQVTVRIGGATLRATADRHEPRLAAAGIGDGKHAFFIDLAPFTAPGSAVLNADVDGIALIASSCPGGLSSRGGIQGAVWLDGTAIRGWALDTGRPNARLSVTLRCGDRWQQAARADRLQPELLTQAIGDGHHGFTVPLPPWLSDEIAEIEVRAEGHALLAGSPLLIAGELRRTAMLGALSGWLRMIGRTIPADLPPCPATIASPDAIALCRETLARLDLASQSASGATVPGQLLPAAANLRHGGPVTPDAVSIVMPVFGGLSETLACLESLLASRARNRTPFDIVVVDDASPLPDLRGRLADLAASGQIRLVEHLENKGFARSVNAGMAIQPDRDAVLINADTMVHHDWLDRLRRACLAAPDIGTATPLSNNGSICGYPRVNAVNPMPPLAGLKHLDDLCSRLNAGVSVDIPTGVGFCLYIKRECLIETGLFDAEAFPRGYGEENDFCRRAEALGWRHVAAMDVFVAHHGTVSFSTEKAALLASGMRVLDGRYPGYRATVERFTQLDPLRAFRRRLDVERVGMEMRRVAGPAGCTLVITTDQGGGTERHVAERMEQLQRSGETVVVLRPAAGGAHGSGGLIQLDIPAREDLCNLVFALPAETDALLTTLERFGPGKIELHHTLNLSAEVLDVVDRLGLPCEVTVHDYSWFCPRITMIDGSGVYCGEPSDTVCERCVALNGSETGERISVESLRQRSKRLFQKAARVVVPTSDAAVRTRRYAGDVNIHIQPHPDLEIPDAIRGPDWDGVRRLRVVLIGAIGHHKGFGVLRDCAWDAVKRDLPLEFTVIGYTFDDASLRATGRVAITGPYAPHEAVDLIRASGADIAVFLSVWPETWCYALTEAWASGLLAFGFGIGAIGERITETGLGALLPLHLTAEGINDRLLESARSCRGQTVFCRK
jgi:GT2 family glycosyltransferase